MKKFFLIIHFPIVFPVWLMFFVGWSIFFGKDGFELALEEWDELVLLKKK